jgi:hypothetical protein
MIRTQCTLGMSLLNAAQEMDLHDCASGRTMPAALDRLVVGLGFVLFCFVGVSESVSVAVYNTSVCVAVHQHCNGSGAPA